MDPEPTIPVSRPWWLATGALLALRLACASWLPLGDDEGYHWVWSRHLAWSYFDHPPMVAWLVAASTSLFGVSLLAIRLPSVLLATLTALQLRALVLETTADRRLADRSSLLFQVVPVFFGIGILVIPDAPLHLFWLLAARALWRRGRWHWMLLGLALGAALLSKYVAILLVFSAAAWLVAERRWAGFAGLAAACGLAAIVFSPVLFWNAHHDWASFRYQFFTRHQGGGVSLERLAIYLSSQFLYLSPMLAWLAARETVRPRRTVAWERFFWWLAAPTLGVFLAASAVTSFKPNWPAPGYLTLLPLVVLGLDRWKTAARPLRAATVAVALLCSLLPAVQWLVPVIPLARGSDPLADMRGWPQATAAAIRADSALRADDPRARPFFAAGRYQNAARLEFGLPGHPPVACLNPGRDSYDDWQDLASLRGRDFVFVTSDRFPTPPDRLVTAESVSVFQRLEIRAGGRTVNGFTVYLGRGFGEVRSSDSRSR